MEKKCLKCGYERRLLDSAPEYECPECGAIYAKVEAAIKKSPAMINTKKPYDKTSTSSKKNEASTKQKIVDISEKDEIRKCPFCAEEIKKDAIKCKHCGELLNKNHAQKTIPKGEIMCPFCKAIIQPEPLQAGCGSVFITIILLCAYIIPGIIYAIWYSSKKQCPECKMTL